MKSFQFKIVFDGGHSTNILVYAFNRSEAHLRAAKQVSTVRYSHDILSITFLQEG